MWESHNFIPEKRSELKFPFIRVNGDSKDGYKMGYGIFNSTEMKDKADEISEVLLLPNMDEPLYKKRLRVEIKKHKAKLVELGGLVDYYLQRMKKELKRTQENTNKVESQEENLMLVKDRWRHTDCSEKLSKLHFNIHLVEQYYSIGEDYFKNYLDFHTLSKIHCDVMDRKRYTV